MTLLRTAFLMLTGLALAACSNGTDDAGKLIRNLPKALTARDPGPVVVTPQQIAAALGATPNPIHVVQIEQRETQFLVLEIESNGPYSTYATSSRQSLTLRRGMITATRGLGGDLMSSEEDALLALVTHRRAGTAPYTMRFLRADNVTIETSATCTTSRGKTVPVKLGTVDSSGIAITANCASPTGNFKNTYVVDRHGTVLSTRQWLGEYLGYVAAQAVRQ